MRRMRERERSGEEGETRRRGEEGKKKEKWR